MLRSIVLSKPRSVHCLPESVCLAVRISYVDETNCSVPPIPCQMAKVTFTSSPVYTVLPQMLHFASRDRFLQAEQILVVLCLHDSRSGSDVLIAHYERLEEQDFLSHDLHRKYD